MNLESAWEGAEWDLFAESWDSQFVFDFEIFYIVILKWSFKNCFCVSHPPLKFWRYRKEHLQSDEGREIISCLKNKKNPVSDRQRQESPHVYENVVWLPRNFSFRAPGPLSYLLEDLKKRNSDRQFFIWKEVFLYFGNDWYIDNDIFFIGVIS